MKNKYIKILFISFVASLGGFLFGYDTAVISGAVEYLQMYFNLTPIMVGWAVSSALVGCVFGSIIAAKLNEKYGRKKVMILGAICFGISALYSAIPVRFDVFVWARILGGVGVGLAASLVPLYISEIAPPNIRGFLGGFFQSAIAIGMLIVYFINYKIASFSTIDWNVSTGWRWMFGSELVPAVLFFLFLFFIPESPRWLMLNKREEEAKKILNGLNEEKEAEIEFNNIKESILQELNKKEEVGIKKLGKKGAKKVIYLCVVIAFLQQVSGINAILYYTPVVLKSVSKSGGVSTYFQSVLIGAIMVLGAILASLIVDKMGRKKMMIIGTFIMSLFMGMMCIEIYSGNITKMAILYVMGYVLAFACSAGPIMWLYIAEILPNSIRAKGVAIASFTVWISNIIVSQTFPMINDNPMLRAKYNGAFPFLVYGFFCIVFFIFSLKLIETKGKMLEEIEKIWLE